MTPQPLITIGIACYRSADTVARAIESALAQDWPNREIVIVDDGSGDNTASVIQSAINGHPEARLVVHPQNKGFAGSLNTIIAEAKGEFVAIFDDDDTSVPHRIRAQYERIAAYEKAHGTKSILCHAARIQKYPNGMQRYEPTMGTMDGPAPHGEAVAARILTGRLSRGVTGSCANCSRMARAEVFRKMNGYDGTLRRAEDTDFNIRFALSGGHFAGIAEPLVFQTMTMGAEKKLDAERMAELSLLEKHKAFLKEIGWFDFAREWLEIRYDFLNDRWTSFATRLFTLAFRHPVKFLQKLFWIVPAHKTRRAYKQWHNKQLEAA